MTLTLDLSAAEEAAFRELAEAPADVRAAALQKALAVLPHGQAANGHNAATTPARPLTALEVLAAPPDMRQAALKANAQASAEYYTSPAGQAEWEELADWRALDGEDFHGFEDEDAAASEQEERKAA